MEVMVALGIFAVGLVAVAAIFPTAITIQRDTVREVDGRRIGKNARAMVLAAARTDSASNPGNPSAEMSYDPGQTTPTAIAPSGSLLPFITAAKGASAANTTPVLPMINQPDPFIGGPVQMLALPSFHGLFTLAARSYPQNSIDPLRRDYYWYPLIQVSDATSPNPRFAMTIIVMHRDGTNRVPEVRRSYDLDKTRTIGNVIAFNAAKGLFDDGTGDVSNDVDNDGLPDFIQPGDTVLGDDGLKHRVILANATSITVDSPNVGNLGTLYFTVAIDSAGFIKREGRSPTVWIEDGIPLSINK